LAATTADFLKKEKATKPPAKDLNGMRDCKKLLAENKAESFKNFLRVCFRFSFFTGTPLINDSSNNKTKYNSLVSSQNKLLLKQRSSETLN
jgi:hypothetical protein